MTALCRGLPADWWETGDDGNDLALLICRRCTGCPDDDPTPHGVIRQGVAYADSGVPLPDCSTCGRLNRTYTGGVSRCDLCTEPRVALPNVRASRDRWIAGLCAQGMSNADVAAEADVSLRTVGRIRNTAVKQPNLPFLHSTPQQKEAA
ncbi:hypothetical protein ACWKSP_26270 [Micromonosporaceae bacterium Da 78-11]